MLYCQSDSCMWYTTVTKHGILSLGCFEETKSNTFNMIFFCPPSILFKPHPKWLPIDCACSPWRCIWESGNSRVKSVSENWRLKMITISHSKHILCSCSYSCCCKQNADKLRTGSRNMETIVVIIISLRILFKLWNVAEQKEWKWQKQNETERWTDKETMN